jgi:hypothetical protein
MAWFRRRWRYPAVAVLVAIWVIAVWRSRNPSAQPAAAGPVAPLPRIAAPVAPPPAPVEPAVTAPLPAVPSTATEPAGPTAAAAVESTRFTNNPLWSAVPSVTSDGSLIFVPYSDNTSARWTPNLRFDVWNRSARNLQRLVLVGADQCPDGDCPPAAAPQLQAQQVAATKLLADLQRKGLHPLSEGSAGDGTHAGYTAEGDHEPSLTIDLAPHGTVTITPRGHAPILRHDAAWRTVPTPEQRRRLDAEIAQGKNGCFHAAMLRAPLVDLVRRVAVVGIGYRGNDTCWESGGDYIIVTW